MSHRPDERARGEPSRRLELSRARRREAKPNHRNHRKISLRLMGFACDQIFSDFLIGFSQISARSALNNARSAPPPLRAAYPPLRDALTRERRPAKRNPHLASAQVNGRVALTMLRSLAGEGFRLERLPLRVTVRRGCCCALLRVTGCGCRPNGMELPLSLARGLPMMRHIDGVWLVDDAVINDKRTSIPFCQKNDALTRKSVTNRNGQALTRERRPAKRNPHLASAQVNGRALLSMMRSLAGEGFRLERLPLRVTVRRGCYCALLRVRGCGCRPNGMELPLSLARGLSTMRQIVGVRAADNAAHRWRAGCR